MESFGVPKKENISNKKDDKLKKKKKRAAIIKGIVTASAIAASEGEALSKTVYVPDNRVVDQEEYKDPRVIEPGKVNAPGAINNPDVMEGVIQNDGKIYREVEIDPDNERKDDGINDLTDMRRGGNVTINGKKYKIDE